jgi:recombinational DNA repair protein (RecF pathway)
MCYFLGRPLREFEHLALEDSVSYALRRMVREHIAWHLGVSGLKSEEFFD